MLKIYSTKIIVLLGVLFVLSLLPLFIKTNDQCENYIKQDELFDSNLTSFNSLKKITNHLDSVYNYNTFSKTLDTSLYVKITSDFVKRRFYHGLSHYSISDNWIAYLSGKLIWSNLSAIVIPDDILKYSGGLCSQQTIVFMELLRRKGINVRSVGLGFKEGPGHFLCEIHYNESWRLHDVTFEPQWAKVDYSHQSMDYYLSNKDSLYLVYQMRMDKKTFDKILEKVVYGDVNGLPAKKMMLFHKTTLVGTYVLPFIFFIFLLLSLLKKKNRIKKI